MRIFKRTERGGVETTRGFIHNLKHPSGKFSMPVKLKAIPGKVNGNPRPPVRVAGFLVFALPDGGSYISKRKLNDRWS